MKDRKLKIDLALSMGLTLLTNAVHYFFNIILAQRLDKEAFSTFTGATGIISLVQIPSVTIQSVITKIVAENLDHDLSDFKKKSLMRFSLGGIILSLLIIALSPVISQATHLPSIAIALTSLTVMSSIISPIPKGLLLGMHKIQLFNILSLVEAIAKFGVGMFALATPDNPNIAIIAFGLPVLIIWVVVSMFIRFDKNTKRAKDVGYDIKESLLVLLTFFLINTPYTLDLTLVNQDSRSAYGALSLLGKVVYYGSILLVSVMFAYIAKEKDHKQKRKIFLYVFGIAAISGIGMTIMYAIGGSLIVDIMFGGKYTEIKNYLVPFAFGMSLYAMSFIIVNYLILVKSRLQIFFLGLASLSQIILFALHNSSLYDAVLNQIVLYILLFVLIGGLMVWEEISQYGKR